MRAQPCSSTRLREASSSFFFFFPQVPVIFCHVWPCDFAAAHGKGGGRGGCGGDQGSSHVMSLYGVNPRGSLWAVTPATALLACSIFFPVLILLRPGFKFNPPQFKVPRVPLVSEGKGPSRNMSVGSANHTIWGMCASHRPVILFLAF